MSNAEPQHPDVSEGATVTHLFAPENSPIQVRGARLDDVKWILDELREFAKFYGTLRQLFPESEEHATKLIERMISKHLFIVAESANHAPVGFISGWVVPHVFNPDIKVLAEAFWWVKPQFRGTRAGGLLLKNFVDWGKRNATWVTMTLEHHSPVKPETLIKRGFRLHESHFLLETDQD